MTIAIIIIIILMSVFFYRRFVLIPMRAMISGEIPCTERHAVQTDDGILLALYRFRPKSGRARYPLIMCHGMSVNRFHLDNGADISLARFFQEAGYDVWLVELRGSGQSTPISLFFPDARFDFDHYVDQDATAIIDYIRERTGAAKVHWLGHSMGGMVLFGYVAHHGDDALASSLIIGSTTEFCDMVPKNRRIYWRIFGLFCTILPSFPVGSFARALFPVLPRLVRRLPQRRPLLGIINPDNLNHSQLLRFYGNAISNLSRGLVLQTVRWLSEGDMTSRDGKTHYATGIERLKTPLFIAASEYDFTIPIHAVRATFDRAGTPYKTLYILKPSSRERAEIGHADIILSTACYTEFFPAMRSWLDEQDDDIKHDRVTAS